VLTRTGSGGSSQLVGGGVLQLLSKEGVERVVVYVVVCEQVGWRLMTNKEALSEANESSGECDWVPRRSKSQAEGSALRRRARSGGWTGRLVKQQSR
jgi:hypothetical protein